MPKPNTISVEYFNAVVQALTSQRNAALDQLAVAQAQAIMAQPMEPTEVADEGTANGPT